jgi:hypothetical protein
LRVSAENNKPNSNKRIIQALNVSDKEGSKFKFVYTKEEPAWKEMKALYVKHFLPQRTRPFATNMLRLFSLCL